VIFTTRAAGLRLLLSLVVLLVCLLPARGSRRAAASTAPCHHLHDSRAWNTVAHHAGSRSCSTPTPVRVTHVVRSRLQRPQVPRGSCNGRAVSSGFHAATIRPGRRRRSASRDVPRRTVDGEVPRVTLRRQEGGVPGAGTRDVVMRSTGESLERVPSGFVPFVTCRRKGKLGRESEHRLLCPCCREVRRRGVLTSSARPRTLRVLGFSCRAAFDGFRPRATGSGPGNRREHPSMAPVRDGLEARSPVSRTRPQVA